VALEETVSGYETLSNKTVSAFMKPHMIPCRDRHQWIGRRGSRDSAQIRMVSTKGKAIHEFRHTLQKAGLRTKPVEPNASQE
jgi:hypothetical protein